MEEKTAKRRAQNVKAAQKSYIAKKQERELLQEKNSELLKDQMQLLHDKCRLEQQIKLLECVVNGIDHIQKCNLSKTSVETATILHPVNEKSITNNANCEETNNLSGQARKILDLSVPSQHPSAASVVFSGTYDLKSTKDRLQKTKRVTFAVTETTTCDEHILDPSSYLAIGATQDVYLDCSAKRADHMDASSSSEDEVYVPVPKKIKRSQAPFIRPMRRVLAM